MSQGLDNFGCLNNTIKVSVGHYVDLVNPDPATIELESIAAALSKVCRFGGHCPRFYSVAEHSVLAANLAYSEGCTKDVLRAVLLHDAAEAYIGDMVKPLKLVVPQYKAIEERIELAIQIAMNVDFQKHHDVIKRFDRAMLKAEKITMWPEDTEKWAGFSDIEDRNVTIHFWSPWQAELKFLDVMRNIELEVP